MYDFRCQGKQKDGPMFGSRRVCVWGAQYTQQECGPNDSLLQMTSAVSASNTAKCCIQRRNMCVCVCVSRLCSWATDRQRCSVTLCLKMCVFGDMGAVWWFSFQSSHTHLVLSISLADGRCICVVYHLGVYEVIYFFKVPYWAGP